MRLTGPAHISVPLVRQASKAGCGAACLLMVLRHFGCSATLNEVTRQVGETALGASAASLCEAAAKYGLSVACYMMSLNELKELTPPAILFWTHKHFVVYEGYSRGVFRIVDPETRAIELSDKKMTDLFSGVVISFRPELQSPTPVLRT